MSEGFEEEDPNDLLMVPATTCSLSVSIVDGGGTAGTDRDPIVIIPLLTISSPSSLRVLAVHSIIFDIENVVMDPLVATTEFGQVCMTANAKKKETTFIEFV